MPNDLNPPLSTRYKYQSRDHRQHRQLSATQPTRHINMKLVIFAVFALLAIASAIAYPSGILGVGVAPAVVAAPAAVGIGPVGIAGGLGWGKAGVWG